MENYIQADDYELWIIIKNGALVPTKPSEDGNTMIPKEPKEFNSADFKMMEKNAKAKKLLYFGLGPDEYVRISECRTAKDIWDALQIAHEGTNQVKQSRIELLMRKYELFEMGDKETVMEMYTRFTHITNELKSLGKSFTTEELVRKILRFLPQSWEAKVTAIQEAKDMESISLDELIGNLQTYELRKNSQQKEEAKKDRGLVLKVMDEDSSDLDDEEMAMITRKFKRFFKKSKEISKKRNFNKAKNNDREQFTGCFKCGKFDHIVKNCPLLKEEQEQEQARKQGRRRFGSSYAKRLSKAMLAAWGDTSDEDEVSEGEEAAVALMAIGESDTDEEALDSLAELKGKVSVLTKAKLEELFLTLIDEYDSMNAENCMLQDACADLKRDIRKLEQENESLENHKSVVDIENLVLNKDLDDLKKSLSMKEAEFSAAYLKLETESLKLKERLEALLNENKDLMEKVNKVDSDLARNRRWNRASLALNWLNTHFNRNKKGLGFVPKKSVYPVNQKYVSLPENIICYHCGKIGHYQSMCALRKRALERSMIYVKQIWVRKDQLGMSKGLGPKWIWVPKTNL